MNSTKRLNWPHTTKMRNQKTSSTCSENPMSKNFAFIPQIFPWDNTKIFTHPPWKENYSIAPHNAKYKFIRVIWGGWKWVVGWWRRRRRKVTKIVTSSSQIHSHSSTYSFIFLSLPHSLPLSLSFIEFYSLHNGFLISLKRFFFFSSRE